MNKTGLPEKSSIYGSYPYGSGYTPSPSIVQQPNQKAIFSLYGPPTPPFTMTTEQLKQRGLIPESKHIKEEAAEKKLQYSSPQHHAISPAHLGQPYQHKDIRDPHNSVIVKRETIPKLENPVAAHTHHASPSSSSPRLQHPRPAHTPEHRPERPLSSSTSPASGIPSHLLHHSSPVSSGTGHPQPHGTVFRPAEAHSSPRSQSPYKPAVSHLQAMPLDYCKPLNANKQQQQLISPVNMSAYSASVGQQEPVSASPSSSSYNYHLIQQGLVPNPIYSQGGSIHSSSRQPSQHANPIPLISSGSFKPLQLSPTGGKRKNYSKDNTSMASRKKAKGQYDHPGTNQPTPIPVTTPQILTNPSPYTTSSSSSFTRPSISSHTSSSLPSNSLSSMSSPYSFQSFVDNTVHSAYLQDQKMALEKAERERVAAVGLTALPNVSKPEPSVQGRRQDFSSSSQRFSGDTHTTSSVAAPSSVTKNIATGISSSSVTSDSYNSRIMDTINRVANNQVDTDSDTLSACSPPPQTKPSGTSSPLNRSLNSSTGSSHPHHMKKAWLQRHDEDKKSETPLPQNQGEEDSNCSLSQARDIISCVENSSTTLADCGKESSTASPANVVVTLPNGNVGDLNHNESTSSASESELQVCRGK